MGSESKWNYKIIIGRNTYTENEISDSTSISTSGSSEGLTIGGCFGCTISGDLLYKGSERTEIHHNEKLTLVCQELLPNGELKSNSLIFFITSYTVEDNFVIHFSAQDAMAYIDNNYPMEGTVSNHFEAASKVVSELCGDGIIIDVPPNSMIDITGQSGWSIRTLMQYASVWGAVNYACRVVDGTTHIGNVVSSTILTIQPENHSKLSVGAKGRIINQVRISVADINDPILESGQTYEDFGIFYVNKSMYVNNVNSLRLICPWADNSFTASTYLMNLPNASYGTEFSCDEVKVDKIYPPMTKIKFADFTDDDDFYIGNASYKLTQIGIIANLSGGTKSLSDYEYIGQTETELKTKVALNLGYKYGFITLEDGIYWDDSAIPSAEVINNG